MNEVVDIEIFKRKLTVSMEGFTPIEVNALAQKVNETMAEIARKNDKIADTSKLATYAALALAGELYKLREAHDTQMRVLEHRIDELARDLQACLAATRPQSG